jgi:hypothetical protein
MTKGPRKKTLRDYTRETPSEEDEQRFKNAMNERSAIVVAVVMAIELEYLLEQLIIGKLKRKDDDTVEILCKDNGALATFFSKIGLSYALGIIDEIQMEHLHTVRRIRNAFAHSRRKISFDTQQVRKELGALRLPKVSKSKTSSYEGISIAKEIAIVRIPPEFANRYTETEHDLGPRAGYVILCLTLSSAFRKKLRRSKKGAVASKAVAPFDQQQPIKGKV